MLVKRGIVKILPFLYFYSTNYIYYIYVIVIHVIFETFLEMEKMEI